MSAPHIYLLFVLSVCPKLSKLIDIWRSSDKNNFAQFFWDTVCKPINLTQKPGLTTFYQRTSEAWTDPELCTVQPAAGDSCARRIYPHAETPPRTTTIRCRCCCCPHCLRWTPLDSLRAQLCRKYDAAPRRQRNYFRLTVSQISTASFRTNRNWNRTWCKQHRYQP